MQDRIKELRKNLKLTQTEFANKLGIKQNTVAVYESAGRIPSEAVIVSICREFNVNRKWLETGEGDMFLPKPVSELPAELTNHPVVRAILEAYIELTPANREIFNSFLDDVAAKFTKP